MSEEILNRVKRSGLITIDLDEIELPTNIFEIDLKEWLHEGLYLKEKEFRQIIKKYNWEKFKNGYVCIFCSSDAIIPLWAYMLVSANLESYSKNIVIGNIEKLYEKIFEDKINEIDFDQYKDKSVIVKGCSNDKTPILAYHLITTKLANKAKSVMYGEACSAVPVFKKRK
tara:strand:- start:725 stop:1234 length:510 start_codon:yes stop_codon:yes gene_type:complete